MHRYGTLAVVVAVTLGLCAFCPTAAQAQVIVYSPPVSPIIPMMGPPVVPRVAVPAPTVTYYQSAPTMVYSAPRVAYRPMTVYSPPTVSTHGAVVTHTYRGFGIFRPRGIYTSSYYQPTITYSPGARATYYQPVIVP